MTMTSFKKWFGKKGIPFSFPSSWSLSFSILVSSFARLTR
jgi:hypothetical protein